MDFKTEISEPESFDNAYKQFKGFVKSKIVVESNGGQASIKAEESKQNKWHLFTLASFYGSRVFEKNNKLRLLKNQSCNIIVPNPINNTPIKIITEWEKTVEFNPVFLSLAESSMINKFATYLSNEDKTKLKEEIHEFVFDKKVSFINGIKFSYQIIDEVLILIKSENGTTKIVSLWKTEWYEI